MTRPASALQRAATLIPANPVLSVVMPVFNERDTIEEIIHRQSADRADRHRRRVDRRHVADPR
jgi:hypothetical protein